uniref:macrophage mannose receptor 1-like n=1 Tax=Maylandia zebra TaxID=106582 RepID=UPI000D2FEC4B|nr:macrophage mannose receptor 1-like [Maylandia zebra]
MEKLVLVIAAALELATIENMEDVKTLTCAQRQYHFVYEQKNWTEAQQHCRQYYTDLAAIESMEDVKTLNNMADLEKMKYSEYSNRAWIGLYNDVNSWRWSMDDTGFYKDGEPELRNWSPEEPNNYKGTECCAEMFDSGLWNDRDCDAVRNAVCIYIAESDVTFVFIKNMMTWTDAQSFCRANYTDLASVRNMSENQKIKELIPKGKKAWIGLFRDSWKWIDGSSSSFRYWDTKEPNNNFHKEMCVAAYFGKEGKWEDWNCDYKRAFVCYSEVRARSKHVVRLGLVKNSSVDLSDPAVMEDVLKQLKQKLKDQRVDGDISLSWRTQSGGEVFYKDEKQTKKEARKVKSSL